MVVVLVMCMNTVNTFAACSLAEENQEKVVAYLISDTGESEKVIGQKVVSPTPFSLVDDTKSCTYMFTLYNNTNYSLTANKTDSSIAVRAYLTINYTSRNTPEEILLNNVSGYWELLDGKARVESTSLTYGCSGAFPVPTTQTNTIAVGNNFSKNTGFTQYVSPEFGVIGANWTLNLAMGSTGSCASGPRRFWTWCAKPRPS